MMGMEGGNTTSHPSLQWALWSEVSITRTPAGTPETEILSSGVLDWGSSYAWNSFHDAPKNRRIAYGWAREELNVGLTAQGWQGLLTLPQELYVCVYEGVQNTADVLLQKGSWTPTRRKDGGWKVTTLGMRPASEVVEKLRKGARKSTVSRKTLKPGSYHPLQAEDGLSLHIHAEIEIPCGATTPVALLVRRTPDAQEQTKIVYDLISQLLSIVRDNSTTLPKGTTAVYPHVAPLFLLDFGKTREALVLDVCVDNSVLEVFANERVAITSRVYPARVDRAGMGLWTGSGDGGVKVKRVEVWAGLKGAWPERPRDSRAELKWDSPEETGWYKWWPGN